MKFFEGRKFVVDLTKTQSKATVLFRKGHFNYVVFLIGFPKFNSISLVLLYAKCSVLVWACVIMCQNIFNCKFWL